MNPVASLARRINFIRPNYVLYAIIALNALVFAAWQYSTESFRKFNDPKAYIFMCKNFLFGEMNLAQGRIWTLLTSCISHEDSTHFLLNMLSLAFMGSHVVMHIGNTAFLSLYFGAGIATALVSLAWNRFVSPWLGRGMHSPQVRAANGGSPQQRASHGASGSVYAILSTFACMSPRTTFLLFFVIPIPAWACISGIFVWDLSQAWFRPGGPIDSAAHIGGILAGVLFWRFKLKGHRV
ncbi:rhomboid-domain-containing protein [Tilletiaria anomala UBC 951]|uniref:Rhomboid-domain-containing protein n=1 Tax=Tilletiaria anomala (strain ATCC 24038 / CBS 436.72 / UBC 951) TaxID=1037660 RepID=A0A066VLT5_TILAU|nr:rhomboid-domain-containing protein [Tilletiaria anomala UBC 951]KDN39545.1 rhomboid-domain-containing protein [Tilletiaria anomala UBC 951]